MFDPAGRGTEHRRIAHKKSAQEGLRTGLQERIEARSPILSERVGRRLAEGMEFSVVGQNLLQPHHIEFYRDPLPNVGIERTVFAKLTWTR